MENVALKIQVLAPTEDDMQTLPKFLGSLVDSVVTLDELKERVAYLESKGIKLRPVNYKVAANDLEYLQKMVEGMEKLGELQAYIDDPNRINDKQAVDRLGYLIGIGAEYKNADGKYAKVVFLDKEFAAQYGEVDFAAEAAKKAETEAKSVEEKVEGVKPQEETPKADESAETPAEVAPEKEPEPTPEPDAGKIQEETPKQAEDKIDEADITAEEVFDEPLEEEVIAEVAGEKPAEPTPEEVPAQEAPEVDAPAEEMPSEDAAEKAGDKAEEPAQEEPKEPTLAELVASDEPIEDTSFEDEIRSELDDAIDFSELEAAFNDIESAKAEGEAPAEETPEVDVPTEEDLMAAELVEDEFVGPYDEMLGKPLTIGFNDETFERYERLTDSVRRVLVDVYGSAEINNTISDNLSRLVIYEVPNDSDVIYVAITHGKEISEEEDQLLRRKIQEVLEYTGILDIDFGRAA